MLNIKYLRSGYIMTNNNDSNNNDSNNNDSNNNDSNTITIKKEEKDLEKRIIKRRNDYLNISNSFRNIKTK